MSRLNLSVINNELELFLFEVVQTFFCLLEKDDFFLNFQIQLKLILRMKTKMINQLKKDISSQRG